jgi:tetratricopeptide (TPR) repeat protein
MMNKLVVLVLLLSISPFTFSQIYKCKDASGKINFTDEPCDGGEDVKLKATNSSQHVESIYTGILDKEYSSTAWYENAVGYAKAKRKADEYKAPMIIYFYTDWCGFCKAVEKNLFPKPKAVNAMKPFVKVKINPEHGGAEEKLFKQMNGSGYPRFLVIPYGEKYKKVGITAGKSSGSRSISVKKFVKRIEKYKPEPLPKSGKEYYQRAASYFENNHYKKALEDIKKAIQYEPRNIDYYKLLDRILIRSKDWLQIIKYWDQFIYSVPDNAEAYEERAGAHFHKGDLDKALADAKKASELGSEDGEKLYQRLLRRSGQ